MMSDSLSSSITSRQEEPHSEVLIIDSLSSAIIVQPSVHNNHTTVHTASTNDDDDDDHHATAVVRKQQQQERHAALRALVSERYIVEWTPEEDERIDPLERAVRFLVPIPKQYYWNVVVPDDWMAIPTHIKVWHRLISGSVAVGEWTNRHVAQPLASGLGLTSSRFHFVTDHMTPQEMEQSRRMVQERKLRNQEMQEVPSTGKDGDAV